MARKRNLMLEWEWTWTWTNWTDEVWINVAWSDEYWCFLHCQKSDLEPNLLCVISSGWWGWCNHAGNTFLSHKYHLMHLSPTVEEFGVHRWPHQIRIQWSAFGMWWNRNWLCSSPICSSNVMQSCQHGPNEYFNTSWNPCHEEFRQSGDESGWWGCHAQHQCAVCYKVDVGGIFCKLLLSWVICLSRKNNLGSAETSKLQNILSECQLSS